MNPHRFDEIGYWSEIKLDIVREYAQAYSRILTAKRLNHFYVDGFAGSGVNLARRSKEFVAGSPLNALNVEPPFRGYFLIDLDGDKIAQLGALPEVGDRPDVHIICGDCNRVLLEEVFPRVKYTDYRRALCVLDPYGLHLDWEIMRTAGHMKSVEIFLNFPIMDMNRNVLWRKPQMASTADQKRMTAFWGDESWRDAAYQHVPTLFGDQWDVKTGNPEVAEAFRQRLGAEGGFAYVSEPFPMRNSTNAIVYYLFFAAQQPVALQIVKAIFRKYKNRMA
ncbi:MAG: three-Cys-motif partner protein TcmP [Dehalococcoidia bacterium]|jgi:three-Cys-motif partner protein